eukprot:403355764
MKTSSTSTDIQQTKNLLNQRSLWSLSLNHHEDRANYSFLKPLEFKFITPQSCSFQNPGGLGVSQAEGIVINQNIGGGSKMYGSQNLYKYNNDTQVGRTIRRNDTALEETDLLKQRTLVELKDLCLVSKIHVKNFKNARVSIYLSEFADYGFKLVNHQKKLMSSKERIIDIGNLPAKYILIEVDKGVPIKALKQDFQVFGVEHTQIESTFGMGTHDVLFDKTYQILYGFK